MRTRGLVSRPKPKSPNPRTCGGPILRGKVGLRVAEPGRNYLNRGGLVEEHGHKGKPSASNFSNVGS